MENLRQAVSGWAQDARGTPGGLIVLGVVTVIAGFLAMGSPLLSGLGVTLLIGIAMVIGGVARTIGAFQAGSFGQGALAFIGGILTFAAGMILAGRPGFGLTTLTLMLGGYLVVDGISGAILAFHARPGKGWAGCCSAPGWACCWASSCSGSGRSPGSGPSARWSGSTWCSRASPSSPSARPRGRWPREVA